jgi:hypothetical protein
MTSIQKFNVKDIKVSGERRPVVKDKVRLIAESMKEIGLRTPLSVRKRNNGDIVLATGLHRLKAAKILGWKEIDCVVMKGGRTRRQLWTIAENLHRSDLTTLQRAEQVSEWKRLVKKLGGDGQAAQPGGHQRTDRGVDAGFIAVARSVLSVAINLLRKSHFLASSSLTIRLDCLHWAYCRVRPKIVNYREKKARHGI